MFARTERLILRPAWPEDAATLAAALAHPDVARNMPRLPAPFDEGEAARWIGRPRDPRLPDLLAYARTRGTPRLIGGASIVAREDGGFELGYWIDRAHWGLGFATEAGRAVMRIARTMGLGRVLGGHFVDNPASGRVLRKLGFRATGSVEPRVSPARGAVVPLAIYELDDETLEVPADPAILALYKDSVLTLV